MTTDDLVCVADGCLPNAVERKPDDENGLIGTCSGKLDIGASCSLACEDGYEMVTSEMSSGKHLLLKYDSDSLVCTKVQLRCNGANSIRSEALQGTAQNFLLPKKVVNRVPRRIHPSGMRKCSEKGTLEIPSSVLK